jgi:eukaryotic-like serine/threonine-protein kinase
MKPGQVMPLNAGEAPPARELPRKKLQRQLKGDLDNIVLKALRKEPARRYATVEQFSEDIRRHLQQVPVSAAPDSISYRCSKFVRRHRMGVVAAILVLLAVAGGVLATLRQARIAQQNEKRAEARFNDVRVLANSLLFDVHDSIADLPGATPARRVLVDRAVRYLDGLAHEATGDLGLQRELAAAYQRLGDVQGQPRAASLGDSGGALQNYLKALQLREGIAQSANASDEDKRRLGEMHRVVAEMLHFSGNLGGALEHARKAVDVESSAPEASGAERSKATLELGRAYRTLGEVEWSGMAFGSFADASAALNDYEKGFEIVSAEIARSPGDAVLLRQQAFLRVQIARTLAQNGSRTRAIQELRTSLAYLRVAGTSSTSTRSQRDLATGLEMLGFALERDGQMRGAYACFNEELAVLTKLFNADTGNLQTRFDWVGANFSMGTSLMRQGKPDAALPFIRRAISHEEQIIPIDNKRLEYRTWLAVFRVGEGEALSRMHRDQQALARFNAARELYNGVVLSDPLDADERLSVSATDAKIAAAFVRMGKFDLAKQAYQRAAAASAPDATSATPKQQAQYTLADSYAGLGDISSRSQMADTCSWYEKSLRIWNAIPNPTLITPNGFDTEGPARVQHELVLHKCAT